MIKSSPKQCSFLAFPNYKDPFILFMDASAQGLGAVVMQEDAAL